MRALGRFFVGIIETVVGCAGWRARSKVSRAPQTPHFSATSAYGHLVFAQGISLGTIRYS